MPSSPRRRGRAVSGALSALAAFTLSAALAVPTSFAAAPSGSSPQPPSDSEIAAAAAIRSKELPPDAGDGPIAQAKAKGVDVPIPSLTTEFSETVATPQGHLREVMHGDQQRVKQGNGWAALDPTLAAGPSGALTPEVAAHQVSLSGGGSGPLATLTSEDGKQLAVGAPFPLPKPVLDGASALYPEVLPGTDLRVTVSKAGGFSTVLIVKNAQAAANPALSKLHWPTTGTGVTVQDDGTGGLTAVDGDNKTVFTAPTPTMWDSSSALPPTASAPRALRAAAAISSDAPASAAPSAPASDPGQPDPALLSSADHPGLGAKDAKLQVHADASGVDLTPDHDLLTGSGVNYPVYIDPDWIHGLSGLADYTWVRSAYAGNNFFNDSHLLGVGVCGSYPTGTNCNPADKERTIYEFDTRGWNSNMVINNATLTTNETASADFSCTKYPVNLYRANGPITNAVTWNNQPGYTYLQQQPVQGAGRSGCSATVPVSWTVTSTMQQAAQNNWATLPFMLQGDEGNAYALKYFDHSPSLTVDFDQVPLQPGNPAIGPNGPHSVYPATGNQQSCNQGWGSFSWLGAGADLSGNFLSAVTASPLQNQTRVWGHLWDYSQNGYPDIFNGWSGWTNNWGTATIPIPAGTLQDGHSYGFSLMASDGVTGFGPSTPSCGFKVDATPPVLSQPNADSVISEAQLQAGVFPPSGNGQAPHAFVNQDGYVPFTATDPAPNGLSSGIACVRWGWDVNASDDQWQCGPNIPDPSKGFPVHPNHWGTNIVYSQVMDNVGNVSPPAQYAFYVPWNPAGPPAVFGDVTGDGLPDIVLPDDNGNLRAITIPAAGLSGASTPVPAGRNPVIAKASVAPYQENTGFTGYQLTHRGSLVGGKNVDDLFVHKPGDKSLYIYDNPGNTGGNGVLDKHETVAKPACQSSTTNCASYQADWSTTQAIAALGDPLRPGLDTGAKFANSTGLVTIESTTGGDAALWYYPTANYQLGNPVNLSASGWFGYDLISTGDWANTGHPGIFARNRASGDIRGLTFNTGTYTYSDDFGTTYSVNTLTGIAVNTSVGGGVTATWWPTIGSDADPTGNTGRMFLWVANANNDVAMWSGQTTSGPGVSWTSGPTTFTSTAAGTSPDSWSLSQASGGQDSNGTNPLHAQNNLVWTTDRKGAANAAAMTNGTATGPVYSSNGLVLDTGKSYTVTAWAKLNGGTGGDQSVVCQDGVNAPSFSLQYQQSTQSWTANTSSQDGWAGNWQNATGAPQTAYSGTWTHLAATFNADTHTLQLYVNGQQAGMATTPAPWSAAKPMTIGACLGNNDTTVVNPLNGAVADVHTYNYALTTDQVDSLYSAPAPVTSDVAANKCLDDNTASSANGTKVQEWTCNPTTAEQFSRVGDDTLRIRGKCLDAAAAGTANGTLIQLWDCNGGANQVFQYRSDKTFYNPASGRCLDINNGNTTDGTQIQLWDCNASPGQRWNPGAVS
ncbi:hypothetical protein GCM10009665_33090 [Kitasatospora nipponensis]|uniref:Ricin-type beta-trefoil lectin protein n=1 Tax=Kitasatospora nipponensis TaxID=258049 RepID=A0ABN1W870_9ACTN